MLNSAIRRLGVCKWTAGLAIHSRTKNGIIPLSPSICVYNSPLLRAICYTRRLGARGQVHSLIYDLEEDVWLVAEAPLNNARQTHATLVNSPDRTRLYGKQLHSAHPRHLQHGSERALGSSTGGHNKNKNGTRLAVREHQHCKKNSDRVRRLRKHVFVTCTSTKLEAQSQVTRPQTLAMIFSQLKSPDLGNTSLVRELRITDMPNGQRLVRWYRPN